MTTEPRRRTDNLYVNPLEQGRPNLKERTTTMLLVVKLVEEELHLKKPQMTGMQRKYSDCLYVDPQV